MAGDLIDELAKVVAALERESIDYALCGGLAMAVYGRVRATVDIDLLVRPRQAAEAITVLHGLGFTIDALPMRLGNIGLEIRRVSRVDPKTGEVLSIDLLVPSSPALDGLFEDRRRLAWQGGTLWVVSRKALRQLKLLRGSGVDNDDISWLEDHEDED